jgi:alpha-ribazole phosphatase
MDVYLTRHTRPDLDGARCYGRLDADLAPGWGEEAGRLAQRLPAGTPIVTSPDRRCRQLAEVLAGDAADRVILESDLQDLDFGTWEGVAWAEIPRHETTWWAADLWNRAPPGGETYAALHARAVAAWSRILLLNADRVLLVGNAGPLRALLTIALELPPAAFVRFHLDHGGLSLLSGDSRGWRLEYANR